MTRTADAKKTVLFAAGVVFIAAALRLIVWFLMPPEFAYAADERGYVGAGLRLYIDGVQDLYWPPATGWIVALIATVFRTESIPLFRLFWILMDCANMCLFALLTLRLVRRAVPERMGVTIAAVTGVMLFYAFYFPAVGFAVIVSSEAPALFLVLSLMILLDASGRLTLRRAALCGVLAGLLVLTRSNLAGLVPAIPAALIIAAPKEGRKTAFRTASVLFIVASCVVWAWLIRNYHATGDLTLSNNSAFNLYIGNNEVYQEDLNIFKPWPTPEQIAFRKDYLAGDFKTATGLTDTEMRDEAVRFVTTHPLLTFRRILGRLARVFPPKTSHLEVVGGEIAVGAFSPTGLSLLGIGALQYAVILAFGFAGLIVLDRFSRYYQVLFAAVIAGCLLLSLVAISKPRFSAQFEPVLMLCSVVFLIDFRRNLSFLLTKRKLPAILIGGFIFWSWAAWLIFSIMSRVMIAS